MGARPRASVPILLCILGVVLPASGCAGWRPWAGAALGALVEDEELDRQEDLLDGGTTGAIRPVATGAESSTAYESGPSPKFLGANSLVHFWRAHWPEVHTRNPMGGLWLPALYASWYREDLGWHPFDPFDAAACGFALSPREEWRPNAASPAPHWLGLWTVRAPAPPFASRSAGFGVGHRRLRVDLRHGLYPGGYTGDGGWGVWAVFRGKPSCSGWV